MKRILKIASILLLISNTYSSDKIALKFDCDLAYVINQEWSSSIKNNIEKKEGMINSIVTKGSSTKLLIKTNGDAEVAVEGKEHIHKLKKFSKFRYIEKSQRGYIYIWTFFKNLNNKKSVLTKNSSFNVGNNPLIQDHTYECKLTI